MPLPLLTPTRPLLPSELPAAEVPGLYIHVPFCFHKCHYCDFYSITRQTPERMARFVDLLLDEATLWARAADRRGSMIPGPAVQPRTVFIGGGTPSLLPLDQMRRLLAGLHDRFDFSALAEWTIECNPATVSPDYCAMLRESGVDRLSFGAQSFDPAELKLLERHHDPEDVYRSLEQARSTGFTRLNLDLIYAIPSQSRGAWLRSLERAMATGVPHLSCYALTYEPNTPITVRKRLGQFRATDDEVELQMLHDTRRRLADAGMPPYEVSNYAYSGEECRHNLLYWTGGSYVGLGPSAASHIEGHRFKNRPHLGEWEQAVASGHLPATDVEVLTPLQRAGELVMLELRLTRGVHFDEFSARTGLDARTIFADPLAQLARAGLLEVAAEGFRLTETGVNVADAIAGQFLLDVP